jgi:DNA modification methylase
MIRCANDTHWLPSDYFGCVVIDPPQTVRNDEVFRWTETDLWRVLRSEGSMIVFHNPALAYTVIPKSDKLNAYTTLDSTLTTHAEYGHPHARPLEAMKRIIALTTGAVLDPYMGSGATLVAARDVGRASVGIDCRATYCASAAARLSTL